MVELVGVGFVIVVFEAEDVLELLQWSDLVVAGEEGWAVAAVRTVLMRLLVGEARHWQLYAVLCDL